MKTIFLLIFLVFSVSVHGGGISLHLSYKESTKKLKVLLLNDSKKGVIISSDLGLNVSKASGLNEINFIFLDEKNKEYYSDNEIRSAPSGNKILLKPGHFIGRTFSLASLTPYYRLDEGSYSVQAVYCMNRCDRMVEGAFSEKVVSNKIKVSIPEGFGDKEAMGVRP